MGIYSTSIFGSSQAWSSLPGADQEKNSAFFTGWAGLCAQLYNATRSAGDVRRQRPPRDQFFKNLHFGDPGGSARVALKPASRQTNTALGESRVTLQRE